MRLKNKIVKYYGTILIGILVFLSVNGMGGRLAFGYGLGDLLYLLILWGITIVYVILFLVTRNKSDAKLIINVIFTIPVVWIILMATVWRGVEYSWNGEIFYTPCRTEVQIENGERKQKKVLSMCSMTYYSDFVGTWNGKELERVSGEIKIPFELRKYMDHPIERVFIEPDYLNRFENGVATKVYRFELDTLKVNREYKLEGEIYKIVDRKPVIRARIN